MSFTSAAYADTSFRPNWAIAPVPLQQKLYANPEMSREERDAVMALELGRARARLARCVLVLKLERRILRNCGLEAMHEFCVMAANVQREFDRRDYADDAFFQPAREAA